MAHGKPPRGPDRSAGDGAPAGSGRSSEDLWERRSRVPLRTARGLDGARLASRAVDPRPAPVPEVSVVVPSLNSGRYIGAAIRSALEQPGPPVEVIVQDGGSSD